MVGYLKVGNNRLAELFKLYVLAVVLAYRNIVAYYLRDHHHSLGDLCVELLLLCGEVFKLLVYGFYFFLDLFGFFLLALSHKTAYLLADLVYLASQLVSLCLAGAVLLVERYYLINEHELLVLEFLFDIFLDYLGVLS